MKIEFHPAKSERDRRERGLPFDLAAEFDWESALYSVDDRKAYPEQRIVAIGHLGTRLHVVCFSEILGGVRIISFRRANLTRDSPLCARNH